MPDPAWLAAEREAQNSEAISVVVVTRYELERLHAIVQAAREYVEATQLASRVEVEPPSPRLYEVGLRQAAAYDALKAAVGPPTEGSDG